ncbi:MAG TPA: PH domain-containing protein [Bacillales bacterium]|nr:PH domain-containing protein [Bacillales bacterium]
MGHRKSLDELNEILNENETIELNMGAFHDSKNGILALTNKRILFVSKGLFSGSTVKEFSFESIHSVEYHTGATGSKITLYSSDHENVFEDIGDPKEEVKRFVDLFNQKMEDPAPASTEQNEEDVIGQLERLAKLKEQGVLTDEEFQAQKEKVLKGS